MSSEPPGPRAQAPLEALGTRIVLHIMPLEMSDRYHGNQLSSTFAQTCLKNRQTACKASLYVRLLAKIRERIFLNLVVKVL